MAAKNNADLSLVWMKDEQVFHEKSPYGDNYDSVRHALSQQTSRCQLVENYAQELDQVKGQTRNKHELSMLESSYKTLQTVANKRLSCLQDLSHVAEMEKMIGALSVECSKRASGLVSTLSTRCSPSLPENAVSGIGRVARGSIRAVDSNWNCLSKLLQCANIHLTNAAAYHKFFHTIAELSQLMPMELRLAQGIVAGDNLVGGSEDAEGLQLQLKAALSIFERWQQEVDGLFERAKKIVPVHERTDKLDRTRPITALCDYKTEEMEIFEGEKLILVDNTKEDIWLVRNKDAKETHVPSVICLIPPPYSKAVKDALRIRLDLLAVWTTSVKCIGITLIKFLLLVFQDWDHEQKGSHESLDDDEKIQLTDVTGYIETSLSSYWQGYPGFQQLQTRFTHLRRLLKQEGSGGNGREVMESLREVHELVKCFQEFWSSWETFKILVETSRHAELILIVDKWQEFKWISPRELLMYWHTGLDFRAGKPPVGEGVSVMLDVEKAQGHPLMRSVSHEESTYHIKHVIDPSSEKRISFKEARELGIVNLDTGTYVVNLDSKEAISFKDAIKEGHVEVESISTKKSAELHREAGLITLESQTRVYTVTGIKDTSNDQMLSVEDAIQKGIYNEETSIVTDTESGTGMPVEDAIGRRLMEVVDRGPALGSESPTTSRNRSYLIHDVHDPISNTWVPFAEACQRKLLNPDTGAYHHQHAAGDKKEYGLEDAINNGFVKASLVQDPDNITECDIDAASNNKLFSVTSRSLNSRLLTSRRPLQARIRRPLPSSERYTE